MCNCEANKLQIDSISARSGKDILDYTVVMSCDCGKNHEYKILYSRHVSDNYPEPNVVDRSYTCLQ